jgi:hypothetical protein
MVGAEKPLKALLDKPIRVILGDQALTENDHESGIGF